MFFDCVYFSNVEVMLLSSLVTRSLTHALKIMGIDLLNNEMPAKKIKARRNTYHARDPQPGRRITRLQTFNGKIETYLILVAFFEILLYVEF